MFSLVKLKNLVNSSNSGVTSVKQVVHFALEPIDLHDLKNEIDVLKYLNNLLFQYYSNVGGVLLGYESINLKNLKKTAGELLVPVDHPFVHIDIQGTFYLFRPVVGGNLLAAVNKKSSGYVDCLVHGMFNVRILMNSGATQVEVGQSVIINVESVSHNKGKMVILANFVEGDTEDNMASFRLVEDVYDFESKEINSEIDDNNNVEKIDNVKLFHGVRVSVALQKETREEGEAVHEIFDEEEQELESRRKSKKRTSKMELRSHKSVLVSGESLDDFQPTKGTSEIKTPNGKELEEKKPKKTFIGPGPISNSYRFLHRDNMPHCSECNRKHKPIKEHQICDLCKAMFTRKKHLLIHKRTVHKMEVISRPNQPFCEECQKFHKHVVCHLDCDVCNEKFSKMELLQRHNYKKHNIIRKERSGASKINYDESNELHCQTCKSSIESETYKIYHEDTVHCREKSTHYVCRFCGYRTIRVTSTQLLEHLRTHTGEKPFKCDLCDKKFAARKTFKNHLKTHANEKSYKCDLCFKGLNQLAGLYYHKKRHHEQVGKNVITTLSQCSPLWKDYAGTNSVCVTVQVSNSIPDIDDIMTGNVAFIPDNPHLLHRLNKPQPIEEEVIDIELKEKV